MKTIDERIAQSEALWRRYRYENMGVRESCGRLFSAAKRSMQKRIRRAATAVNYAMTRTCFSPSYDKAKENLVVSLTSTESRIRRIFPTLCSLAGQKRKPDIIVLWLGDKGAYPPSVISRIEDMGIMVRYREDVGPNTKYFYAFDEFKNDLVITVDDDIIYDRMMTEELYGGHLEHPDTVVARRVHKIRFSPSKKPVRYSDWIWEYRGGGGPAHDLLATGVGGVLYPPAVMAGMTPANRDFLKVCPMCDDIWLKFCEVEGGIKVYPVCASRFDLDVIRPGSQKRSLAVKNIDGGRNDRAVKACANYFGLRHDLCERFLEV